MSFTLMYHYITDSAYKHLWTPGLMNSSAQNSMHAQISKALLELENSTEEMYQRFPQFVLQHCNCLLATVGIINERLADATLVGVEAVQASFKPWESMKNTGQPAALRELVDLVAGRQRTMHQLGMWV